MGHNLYSEYFGISPPQEVHNEHDSRHRRVLMDVVVCCFDALEDEQCVAVCLHFRRDTETVRAIGAGPIGGVGVGVGSYFGRPGSGEPFDHLYLQNCGYLCIHINSALGSVP